MPTALVGSTDVNGVPRNGAYNVTFNHPRELARMSQRPPLQPLASWSAELAAFQLRIQQMIDATADFNAAPRAFLEAYGVKPFMISDLRSWALADARNILESNHLQAATTDCPGGVVHAVLAAAMRGTYGTDGARIPVCFGGLPSAWI